MRVVTSCLTRFWIFDQAFQLHRHGVLQQLIHGGPLSLSRQWSIPDSRVRALPVFGASLALVRASMRPRRPSSNQRRVHAMHALWSQTVSLCLPRDAEVFISLSGFGLPAMRRARRFGHVTVIDHGSLHERVERKLLDEEDERWGLPKWRRWPPQWLIDQQQAEFLEADCILVLSKLAATTLAAQGVPAHKILVNPPGVSLSDFAPRKRVDNVFRVIQCGGINARKGVQYLLQAFSELNLPNSELWFVGPGLEKTELSKIIERYRRPNIIFKGAVQQRQLPEMYGQCSVSVLASVADGFGLVVPQAMACGLPVIVTDHVGAADLVNNGQNGYVVPGRDAEALKQHLRLMYEQPQVRAEMGRAARRTVEVGWSWSSYGDRLVGFLEGALRGAAARI